MKKLIALVISCAVCFCAMLFLALPVHAQINRDTIDRISWKFNSDTGTLHVNCNGYFMSESIPWKEHCENIRSIVLEEGISVIYDVTPFAACSNITEITIPSSLREIQCYYGYSFKDCKSLKTVKSYSRSIIPVVGSQDYAYLAYNADNVIWEACDDGVCGDDLAYTFDSKSGTLKIVGSGYMKFESDYSPWNRYCEYIKSIDIESGVTSIEDNAFAGCCNLTQIKIPNSIESIGKKAFSNCESLSKITIPHSVDKIKAGAFNGCTSLKTVVNYSKLDIKSGKGFLLNGGVAYYADDVLNLHFYPLAIIIALISFIGAVIIIVILIKEKRSESKTTSGITAE